jgi:hypothetical protein
MILVYKLIIEIMDVLYILYEGTLVNSNVQLIVLLFSVL